MRIGSVKAASWGGRFAADPHETSWIHFSLTPTVVCESYGKLMNLPSEVASMVAVASAPAGPCAETRSETATPSKTTPSGVGKKKVDVLEYVNGLPVLSTISFTDVSST